jgi:uncharacterized membrane protein
VTDEELRSSGFEGLVDDYLRRLRSAARALPRRTRREVLTEVREHIAAARAAGEGTDEASVRNLLKGLGDPDEIAAAARAEAGPEQPGAGGRQVAAIIVLLVGGVLGLVFGIPGALAGWIVGVVLLWTSPRWRWGDKLVGTLIWPGGLAAPLFLTAFATTTSAYSCGSSAGGLQSCQPPGPSVLAIAGEITLALVIFAAPVVVAIYLLRRARNAPAAVG